MLSAMSFFQSCPPTPVSPLSRYLVTHPVLKDVTIRADVGEESKVVFDSGLGFRHITLLIEPILSKMTKELAIHPGMGKNYPDKPTFPGKLNDDVITA